MNTFLHRAALLLATVLILVSTSALAQKDQTGTVFGVSPAGVISDGGVSLEFLGISDGLAARASFDVNGTTNSWQYWFYYRLSGDTQENSLPPPDSEAYAGDTATLGWTDLNGSGVDATLVLVIEETAGGGTAALLTADLSFENTGASNDTINIFWYVDYDISGSFGDDSATLVAAPDWIRVTDGTTTDEADMRAGGADAFQVATYSDVRAILDDAAIDDLDDSGLPFGPSDFTAAMQWADLDLFAGGTTTVQGILAYNQASPEPADPIITGGPPEITSVSPDTGPASGGTAVTISGSGFEAGATVTFDGNPAANINVVDANTITCETPPGTAGAVDVTVENPDTQSDTLAGGFTYIAGPTISDVTPDSGSESGGTAVTISGDDFQAGASVTFGGNACANINVVDANTITCDTPPGAPGSVDVTVENPDAQSDTLADGFTYLADPDPAPSIASVTPDTGSESGGTAITISGSDFQAGATVTVGGAACANINVVDANTITCDTPPGAPGSVDVTVENPDAQSDTLADGFTYLADPDPAPSIASVTPDTGSEAGGTVITISGSDFQAGATVTVGGAACANINVVDANTITCETPAGAVGAADVTVENPDAQSATLPGGFTYEPAGAQPAAISVPVMGLTGLLVLLLTVFGVGLVNSRRV